MLVSRRFSRPLTLACATAALAVAPGSAVAMPATDPPPSTLDDRIIVDPPRSDPTRASDTTLALIFSGTALLIAAGGLGLAGRDHQRIRHIMR